MSEAKKKLVVLDLDGTLLNSEMKIPAPAREFLKELVGCGHVVTLATGRPLTSTREYALELGIDAPLAVLNGSWVTNIHGRDFCLHAIEQALALEFFDFCGQAGITCSAVTAGKIYINRPDAHAISMHEFYDKITPLLISNLHTLNQPVLNFFLNNASSERMETIFQKLNETFAPQLQVVKVGNSMVDVLAPGVSKGLALCFLAQNLGFSLADTIAIGDNHNDIEMLKVAGTGVAMATADPEVQAAADMVTLSCDEDGVVLALKQLL